MKVLTYSMSLNGEFSSTLCATRYIKDAFGKEDEFSEIIMNKTGAVSDEELAQFADADLVVFATSMYHFIIASQAMEAMKKIGEYLKDKCPGKPVTVFMTSNYLMDPLVRQYVESWTKSYGLKYIKGFNMHMNDIVEDEKRDRAFAWFQSVRLMAGGSDLSADEPANVVILQADDNAKTAEIAEKYKSEFESRNTTVRMLKITDYNIKPCLGCQYCYTDRKCFMEETDDFVKALRDTFNNVDVLLTVGEINNGFYSPEYKCFFDRHVFMGRCPYPIIPEVVTFYSYYKGPNYNENDYRLIETWADAMGSFGGDVYLGIFEGFDRDSVQAAIAALNAGSSYYDNMYRNYISMQFADLAYEIQNIEPLDYKCFQSIGAYEPVPLNTNCRPVHSMEAAKKAIEMKSFAIRSIRSQVKSEYVKKPRRVHKGEDILNMVQNPPFANDETSKTKKKGFGLFKKG